MSGIEASVWLAVISAGAALLSFPFFIERAWRTAKILVGVAVFLTLPLILRLLVAAVLS